MLCGPAERRRVSDDVARVYKVCLCTLNERLCKLNERLCKLNEPLCKLNVALRRLNLCLFQDAKALREGSGRNSYEIVVLR